jgi:hypothetical protein
MGANHRGRSTRNFNNVIFEGPMGWFQSRRIRMEGFSIHCRRTDIATEGGACLVSDEGSE